MVIPFFLLFPTDDYHTEPLIFTKRFSVGHFWSPFHTKNKGVFRKCFVTFQATISCKHSVSISCKIPHFHSVSPFVSLYVTIPRQRLWVLREKLFQVSLFFFAKNTIKANLILFSLILKFRSPNAKNNSIKIFFLF